MYLEHPEEWRKLAEDLKIATRAGVPTAFDTETIGCDPDTETPVHNARCIVWSCAIADGDLQPRGYRKARGYMLPWYALTESTCFHPWLRGVYGPIWAHNARFDRHVLANLGVNTGNVKDAIDYLRVIDPGHESYALKKCMQRYLGIDGVKTFKQTFSEARSKLVKRKKRFCVENALHALGKKRKACPECNGGLRTDTWVDQKPLKPRPVSLQEAFGLTYDLRITPFDSTLWLRGEEYACLDSVAEASLASLFWDGRAWLESHNQTKLPRIAAAAQELKKIKDKYK